MMFKSIFTKKDVQNFMKRSGDYNPIHWDNAYSSRRMFGSPIVHGSLILTRFIELFFRDMKFKISNLECIFIKPVFLNQTVYYNYENISNNIQVTLINNKKDLLSSFYFTYSELKKNEKASKNLFSKNINLNNSINFNKKKITNLKKIKINFRFSKNNNKNFIFHILNNVSRSIGMELPGLNSLFYKIKINEVKKFYDKPFIKIHSYEKKINLLNLNYYVSNFKISSDVFILPDFRNLNYTDKIKKLIKSTNNYLNDKKILILGGSRGVGFITTQFLSLSRAKVTSTYNYNKSELINFKLSNKVSNLRIKKFDINNNNNLRILLKEINKFDYIFYFVTPKIIKNPNRSFDKDYFNVLQNIYVKKLSEITKKINKNIKFFIPSTVILENKTDDFKEYKKAKINLEKFCHYSKRGNKKIEFYIPRLKYFSTDQNFDFLAKDDSNDLIYLFNHLKSFINAK